MPLDFTDLGAKPAEQSLDFSDLGASPVAAQPANKPTIDFSDLGATQVRDIDFSDLGAQPVILSQKEQADATLRRAGVEQVVDGEQKKTGRGYVLAAATHFIEGAALGTLGGEFYGAVNAVLDKLGGADGLKEAYYKRQKEFDDLLAATGEKYGAASGAGTAAGLVAGVVPMFSSSVASLPFRGALALDAGLGALSGAGASATKLTDEDRTGLVVDIGIGMGLGMAIPSVLKGAGYAAKAAKAKASPLVADWLVDGLGKGSGLNFDDAVKAARAENSEVESVLQKYVFGGKEADAWLESFDDFNRTVSNEEADTLASVLLPKKRASRAAMEADAPVSREELFEALKSERVKFGVNAFGDAVNASNVDDALAMVNKRLAKEGADYGVMAWDQYRTYQYGVQYLRDNLVPQSSTWAGKTLRRAAMLLADAKYVFNAIDNRWGTSLEMAHNRLSQAHDLTTIAAGAVSARIKPMLESARKLGLLEVIEDTHVPVTKEGVEAVPEVVKASKLYHAITNSDNTVLEGLNAEQRELVGEFRKVMSDLLEQGKEAGLKIENLGETYLPMRMKPMEEFVAAIRARTDDLTERYGVKSYVELSEEQINKILSNPYDKDQELLQALSMVEGYPIKSVRQFKAAMMHANDMDKVRDKLYTSAAATFEREGSIPAFVRDVDVGSLITGWATNTFKHAYSRGPLAEIRTMAKLFDNEAIKGVKADANASSYLHNFIADITGTRSGTLATMSSNAMASLKATILNKAERSRGVERLSWQLAYNTDNLLRAALHNIYSNFLGWSVRALSRNMTQVPLLTAMEVAGTGGSTIDRAMRTAAAQGLAVSAAAETAAAMAAGRTIKLKNPQLARMMGKKVGDEVTIRHPKWHLQNEGLAPAEFVGELAPAEMVGAVESGMSRTARVGKEALAAQAKWSMYLYAYSDFVNRDITVNISKRLTEHYIEALQAVSQGQRLTREMDLAVNFAKSMPLSYQRQLRDASLPLLKGGKGDVKAFEDIGHAMADYLVSKTQFSYNRVALSEYGRTMGAFFTMFTKWPLAVASDMVQRQMVAGQQGRGQLGGLVDNMQKYFLPLAALGAADQLLLRDEDGEMDDRTKMLFGAQGLWQWAPGASAVDLATLKTFKVPAIDAIATLGDMVYNKNEGKVARALEKGFRSYVPGVATLRFLTEDLPALTENENPKTIRKLFRDDDNE